MATQSNVVSMVDEYGSRTIGYACNGFVEQHGSGDGMDGAELEFTRGELINLYFGLGYLKGAAEYSSEVGRKITNQEAIDSVEWLRARTVVTPDGKAIEALQDRVYSVLKFEDLVSCKLLFLPLDAGIIPQVGRFWLSVHVPAGKRLSPDMESLCEKLIDSTYCGIETDLDDYSFVQRLVLASGPVEKTQFPRH